MTTIVNDNQLILILTEYGLSRIAEAVSNPAMNLNITKIKLGSGRNNEYYEPNPMQEELEGDLGLEFYILDKTLLEDEVTVSFHAVVPESVGSPTSTTSIYKVDSLVFPDLSETEKLYSNVPICLFAGLYVVEINLMESDTSPSVSSHAVI